MANNKLQAQAENKLKIADHLLGTTFALVKDPKLLVSVTDALFQALDISIDAILEFEKNFKGIEYKESEKLEIFRRKIVTKYGLSEHIVDFYLELKLTLDTHRKSDVEFTKKEKFVMSGEDYDLKTLTHDAVKEQYTQAKSYVGQIFDIINKYE